MHISTLVLCDAVSTREGLLHVLGGGITYIQRPSYPAPLLSDLGVVVSHRGSAILDLVVTLRKDGDSQTLAEIKFEGQSELDPQARPNSYAATPLPIDARGLAIPSAGNYTFTASLKGGKGMTVNFTAVEDPNAEAPAPEH